MSDSYMLVTVLNEEPEVRQALGSVIIILWIVFFAIAVLVSLVATMAKVLVYISLVKRRREEFGPLAITDEYSRKHRMLHEDAKNSLLLTYGDILMG